MGRLVRDARLETREARSRLLTRKEPHWRIIQEGVHLGYYKGKTGKWYVRATLKNGKYRWEAIAEADDTTDANGVNILNYSQAQEKARSIASRIALGDDHERNSKYTVKNATEDYLSNFKTHGKKSFHSTEKQINCHILPIFGDKLVTDLTYKELDAWKNNLANSSKRLRSSKLNKKKDTAQNYKPDDGSDPEYQRKRRATANRILINHQSYLNFLQQR